MLSVFVAGQFWSPSQSPRVCNPISCWTLGCGNHMMTMSSAPRLSHTKMRRPFSISVFKTRSLVFGVLLLYGNNLMSLPSQWHMRIFGLGFIVYIWWLYFQLTVIAIVWCKRKDHPTLAYFCSPYHAVLHILVFQPTSLHRFQRIYSRRRLWSRQQL